GLEGIERGVQSRPDVALVDIGLPGLDGYGVARRLRESLGGDVLLVALTGYGLPEDRRRALEGGFDAHLTKPVTLRSVLRLLAAFRLSHGGAPPRRGSFRGVLSRRSAVSFRRSALIALPPSKPGPRFARPGHRRGVFPPRSARPATRRSPAAFSF